MGNPRQCETGPGTECVQLQQLVERMADFLGEEVVVEEDAAQQVAPDVEGFIVDLENAPDAFGKRQDWSVVRFYVFVVVAEQ